MDPFFNHDRKVASNAIPTPNPIFEEIYGQVKSEYGVDGLLELVRFITSNALMDAEQELKRSEMAVIDCKNIIQAINSVTQPTPKNSPY